MVRSLRGRFPGAALTVVTNRDSERAIKEWGMSLKVMAYPEPLFTPRVFSSWWKEYIPEKPYSLVAAIYPYGTVKGYEDVTQVMRMVPAQRRAGFNLFGEVFDIDDGVAKEEPL